MGLNQRARRAWTSSALVQPANRLALQPDSYPLAIGYWRLVKGKFHHKDTKSTKCRRINVLRFVKDKAR